MRNDLGPSGCMTTGVLARRWVCQRLGLRVDDVHPDVGEVRPIGNIRRVSLINTHIYGLSAGETASIRPWEKGTVSRSNFAPRKVTFSQWRKMMACCTRSGKISVAPVA